MTKGSDERGHMSSSKAAQAMCRHQGKVETCPGTRHAKAITVCTKACQEGRRVWWHHKQGRFGHVMAWELHRFMAAL